MHLCDWLWPGHMHGDPPIWASFHSLIGCLSFPAHPAITLSHPWPHIRLPSLAHVLLCLRSAVQRRAVECSAAQCSTHPRRHRPAFDGSREQSCPCAPERVGALHRCAALPSSCECRLLCSLEEFDGIARDRGEASRWPEYDSKWLLQTICLRSPARILQ